MQPTSLKRTDRDWDSTPQQTKRGRVEEERDKPDYIMPFDQDLRLKLVHIDDKVIASCRQRALKLTVTTALECLLNHCPYVKTIDIGVSTCDMHLLSILNRCGAQITSMQLRVDTFTVPRLTLCGMKELYSLSIIALRERIPTIGSSPKLQNCLTGIPGLDYSIETEASDEMQLDKL